MGSKRACGTHRGEVSRWHYVGDVRNCWGGGRGGGGLRSESAKVGDGLRQMLRTPAELNIEIGRGQGRAYGVLICASADLASLVRRVWWHWCRHPGGSSATEWKVGCGCQWG